MKRNTRTLAKYLFSKGIESSLKIQKMLFFFRVEELQSNKLKNSFFQEKDNFEAWIYGPVNTDSFCYMRNYFSGDDEKEAYLLTQKEIKQIDKHYGRWFEKYKNLTPSELVSLSHKNQSWINARVGLGINDICKKKMLEDETFTTFAE